jgi:ADP-ribosyl-[dinitrogen reductase] hydrolase
LNQHKCAALHPYGRASMNTDQLNTAIRSLGSALFDGRPGARMESTKATPGVPDGLHDKFRGVLLGLAVGDALGAPLEFQPARSPGDYVAEMIGGGWQQLGPGEWTDDTQLALCVVESLLAKSVFDPDDIARRFVKWMESGPKDIGLHTQRVLAAIKSGTPWEHASAKAQDTDLENAPNGSLMRCAPLAMFFFRHPDYAASLSPVLSRVTHAHPDCEAACVLVSVAITHLLMGVGVADAIDAGYSACESVSDAFRESVRRAMQPSNATSPTGWVLDTLEVALWSLLHTSTFEQAIVEAVNRGADADTVGAVTGALAGAHYGLSAIPARWLSALSECDRLLRNADRLFQLANAAD